MRLHGNQHLIRSGQGIDGQHTQGGAAVQQNHIVLFADTVQVFAVNLGIGLAREGKKVLLVDMDSQGSLTASLGSWCSPA